VKPTRFCKVKEGGGSKGGEVAQLLRNRVQKLKRDLRKKAKMTLFLNVAKRIDSWENLTSKKNQKKDGQPQPYYTYIAQYKN
jgi:hypothetical protein